MKNAQRTGKVDEIRAIEPNNHQFLHQKELQLEEQYLVLAEEQTSFM